MENKIFYHAFKTNRLFLYYTHKKCVLVILHLHILYLQQSLLLYCLSFFFSLLIPLSPPRHSKLRLRERIIPNIKLHYNNVDILSG